MTSTTTTQVQTRTRRNVLKDYELHHSPGLSPAAPNTPSAPAPGLQPTVSNPPGWDTGHRRVPPYRPTNRDRDQAEVRVYTSPIERVFIGTMFTGVFVNATAAKAWRRTLGRFNEAAFTYPIGGEF